MRDFAFAELSRSGLPQHARSSYAIVAVVYILVVAVLVQTKTQPVRVSSAGSPFASMTAYVPGPAAAGHAAPTSKQVAPANQALTAKPALRANAAKSVADQEPAVAVSAGAVGQATGPVRFGSGGSLTLIKKVQPIYPALMQTARVTGQVVLDAIIHPDGTIGDITVLQSTNDAFAQSAIAAVKRWRYTAPGFEGVLTVSVNFTLPG